MTNTADAPTSTEAPASPEALDAAAAAASSGAVSSPAPAPSPEAPAPASGEPGEGSPSLQDYVEDDSLDLDSSGLPDATIKELRDLRKQTQKYRETAKPWTEATKGWRDEDIDTLRQALEQGPQNPDIVGEWMLNSAKSLLGDRFEEVVGIKPADLPEVGERDEDGNLIGPDDVARIVEEKIAEREAARAAKDAEAEQARKLEAQVASIKAKTEALGFGPSHRLHGSLLLVARNETNGDLDKAAELLREELGLDPTTAAPSGDSAEAGHTPAPPEGGTPDGTKRPGSTRAAVEERVAKVLGNRKGFNDPLE